MSGANLVKVQRYVFFLVAVLALLNGYLPAARAQNALNQAIYDHMQGNDSGGANAAGNPVPIPADGTPTGPALGQLQPVQPIPGNGVAPPPQSSTQSPQSDTAQNPAGSTAAYQTTPDMPPAPPPPFGSQLFAQPSLIAKLQPTNPDYIMDTGDRVALNMWGAFSFSGLQTIDSDGNIFIPEVGPVRLRGRAASQLNDALHAATQSVFTSSVSIYATLLTRQPINVFVTGSVHNPGRYPGESAGSIIAFLAEAGGIDPVAGSYRNVRVLRGEATIARIDLYDFLINGILPPIKLQEGDTIVVGPQGPTVTAAGDAENVYRFEVDTRSTFGKDLLSLARPKPNVAYVSITGTHAGEPFNAYVSFDTFLRTSLTNGDTYTFLGDGVSKNIFVAVNGQSSGPSQLSIPRYAKLGDVLKFIEVNPQTADIDAIYLRRKSVADQQARALETSLSALQRAVLTSPAASEGDAQVRVQEANLVQQFVQQARALRPEGRVVLAKNPYRLDTTLEPDDEIVIPTKNNLVLISGEVQLPQTVLFQRGASISDYADQAGGFTNRADTSRFIVIRRSGAVETGHSITIQPGDNIMVMTEAGTHDFVVFREIVGILYQIAIAAAATINSAGLR
jgi:protein involved in polysaccharide export with SLBB domain